MWRESQTPGVPDTPIRTVSMASQQSRHMKNCGSVISPAWEPLGQEENHRNSNIFRGFDVLISLISSSPETKP